MPAVSVTDMAVKDNDLVISTKGRSFWILDSLAPLRQAGEQIARDSVHLYKPDTAWRTRLGSTNPRNLVWVGQNAPDGAVIDYYLRTKPQTDEKITLEIVDSQGKVIRKYTNKSTEHDVQPPEGEEFHPPAAIPAEAGMNRFVWDLRCETPTLIPGQVWDSADAPKGPLALPGNYQVRLIAAGQMHTQPLTVKLDPRVKAAPDALQKEFDFSLKIRDEISLADQTVNEMNSVREQMDALKKRIGSSAQAQAVKQSCDAIEKKMKPIDDKLWQRQMKASEEDLNYPDEINDQLKGIAEFVEGSDNAPTAADYAAYQDLSGKVTQFVAEWRDIKAKDLAALNDQIRRANIQTIAPVTASQPDDTSK